MVCGATKYGDKKFWDSQFAEGIYGETYEWVADFSVFAPILQPLLREQPGGASKCRVLNVGCGNSELPEQLYDEFGVRHCTSVDFSSKAIASMRQRNSVSRPELAWEVCDCTDMRGLFADGTFDLVVEKGLLDAMACRRDESKRRLDFRAVLDEVGRVLAAGGAYVLATVDPERHRQLCQAAGGALQGFRLERTAALPPPQGSNALLWPSQATAFVLRRASAPPRPPEVKKTGSWSAPILRSMEHYGSGVQYWDHRYEGDPLPFEWLRHYKHVADLIEEVTGGRRDCRVLDAGCGNSELGEKMYDAGYTDIVSIDNSSVAIQKMTAKNKQRPQMRWQQMDATAMEFCSSTFDCVIDKSLTDTLACLPLGERVQAIQAFVSEAVRVLSPGGVFLCISLTSPAERLHCLQHPEFSEVSVRTLPPTRLDGSEAFAYIGRKVGRAGTITSLLDEMD